MRLHQRDRPVLILLLDRLQDLPVLGIHPAAHLTRFGRAEPRPEQGIPVGVNGRGDELVAGSPQNHVVEGVVNSDQGLDVIGAIRDRVVLDAAPHLGKIVLCAIADRQTNRPHLDHLLDAQHLGLHLDGIALVRRDVHQVAQLAPAEPRQQECAPAVHHIEHTAQRQRTNRLPHGRSGHVEEARQFRLGGQWLLLDECTADNGVQDLLHRSGDHVDGHPTSRGLGMEMYRGTSMRMRDTRAPVTGNVDNDTR